MVKQTAQAKLEVIKTEISLNARRFAGALPNTVPTNRFMEFALASVVKKKALLECTTASVLRSLYLCAALGLFPETPQGEAWLVPFRDKKKGVLEATFIAGYQGYLKLIFQSELIAAIEARVVYNEDVAQGTFRYQYGTDPRIEHEPAMVEDPGELLYTYATGWPAVKYARPTFVVMSRREVLAIRDNSPAGKWKTGPWFEPLDAYNRPVHEAAMWKKTGIRQLRKTLPQADDRIALLAHVEDNTEAGKFMDPLMLPAAIREAFESEVSEQEVKVGAGDLESTLSKATAGLEPETAEPVTKPTRKRKTAKKKTAKGTSAAVSAWKKAEKAAKEKTAVKKSPPRKPKAEKAEPEQPEPEKPVGPTADDVLAFFQANREKLPPSYIHRWTRERMIDYAPKACQEIMDEGNALISQMDKKKATKGER